MEPTPRRGTVKRFTGHRQPVGNPTPGRRVTRHRAGESLTDRTQPTAPLPPPAFYPEGTQDHKLPVHTTVVPNRIGYHLDIARSTVGRVLGRYWMPPLACIDQATALPVRKIPPRRYEKSAPGELVHVDIKKLGRIPDGGGWKVHGKGTGRHHRSRRAANRPARQKSYRYLHHAVDDFSRVVYSEILDDERKETAAGFWTRARGFSLHWV